MRRTSSTPIMITVVDLRCINIVSPHNYFLPPIPVQSMHIVVIATFPMLIVMKIPDADNQFVILMIFTGCSMKLNFIPASSPA